MTAAAVPRHFAIWPKRLPRQLALPDTSLWFNLEVSARRYPDKAAYSFFGRRLSFADLLAQAEALAGWLQAQGIAKGDRVAVFMQNCPQFAIAVHAMLRADAVVVPVNPMNKADEFGHYITDPGTKIVLTTADLVGIVAEADGRLPAAQRLRHVVATRLTEAMPTRLGAAALHQRHHRPAQGLHPQPPHADAQRDVRRPLGFQHARVGEPGRGADVPHHRLHLRLPWVRWRAAPPR